MTDDERSRASKVVIKGLRERNRLLKMIEKEKHTPKPQFVEKTVSEPKGVPYSSQLTTFKTFTPETLTKIDDKPVKTGPRIVQTTTVTPTTTKDVVFKKKTIETTFTPPKTPIEKKGIISELAETHAVIPRYIGKAFKKIEKVAGAKTEKEKEFVWESAFGGLGRGVGSFVRGRAKMAEYEAKGVKKYSKLPSDVITRTEKSRQDHLKQLDKYVQDERKKGFSEYNKFSEDVIKDKSLSASERKAFLDNIKSERNKWDAELTKASMKEAARINTQLEREALRWFNVDRREEKFKSYMVGVTVAAVTAPLFVSGISAIGGAYGAGKLAIAGGVGKAGIAKSIIGGGIAGAKGVAPILPTTVAAGGISGAVEPVTSALVEAGPGRVYRGGEEFIIGAAEKAGLSREEALTSMWAGVLAGGRVAAKEFVKRDIKPSDVLTGVTKVGAQAGVFLGVEKALLSTGLLIPPSIREPYVVSVKPGEGPSFRAGKKIGRPFKVFEFDKPARAGFGIKETYPSLRVTGEGTLLVKVGGKKPEIAYVSEAKVDGKYDTRFYGIKGTKDVTGKLKTISMGDEAITGGKLTIGGKPTQVAYTTKITPESIGVQVKPAGIGKFVSTELAAPSGLKLQGIGVVGGKGFGFKAYQAGDVRLFGSGRGFKELLRSGGDDVVSGVYRSLGETTARIRTPLIEGLRIKPTYGKSIVESVKPFSRSVIFGHGVKGAKIDVFGEIGGLRTVEKAARVREWGITAGGKQFTRWKPTVKLQYGLRDQIPFYTRGIHTEQLTGAYIFRTPKPSAAISKLTKETQSIVFGKGAVDVLTKPTKTVAEKAAEASAKAIMKTISRPDVTLLTKGAIAGRGEAVTAAVFGGAEAAAFSKVLPGIVSGLAPPIVKPVVETGVEAKFDMQALTKFEVPSKQVGLVEKKTPQDLLKPAKVHRQYIWQKPDVRLGQVPIQVPILRPKQALISRSVSLTRTQPKYDVPIDVVGIGITAPVTVPTPPVIPLGIGGIPLPGSRKYYTGVSRGLGRRRRINPLVTGKQKLKILGLGKKKKVRGGRRKKK